jgi:hypothetical protein
MKHAEVHPSLDVDGCFGCKVAGVRMGFNTTTTRGAKVAEVNQREKGWGKDMPAYKRLRQQGLQPRQIDGSALLESRATERWQIEGAPVATPTPVE